MSDSINVCLACDDNYSKYAGVVIASVLANAKSDDDLTFYILDGGISETRKSEILSLKSIKPCDIKFIDIDERLFEDYKQVKSHKYITLASYYRLKLPSLLPDVSRIIYLDCDMIVTTSLSGLFNKKLGEKPLAGVSDIKKKMVKNNPTYVNAGMLVMDLDNMRKQNIEEKFLEWAKSHTNNIRTGDQEIINEVCRGNILVVEDEWNVQSSNFTNRSSYTNNPKIIHFTAKLKPWHYASFSYHRNLYFKYLQMTPWKLSPEELKHWTKDNQIASLIAYFKYRPLFLLRPMFYKALWYTYLQPNLKNIFSMEDYGETHRIVKIFGIKIKYPKRKFAKLRSENAYYYYKKNNIDITTLPPATGQIRDIQLANLTLLKELDYVCKQSGLKYWLDAGTAIGAIRHKGFIPWDDDIDTAMLRCDYEKVIEAFKKFSRNPDIFAGYVRDAKNPAQYMIKVQHKKLPFLFVDIFPFDFWGKAMSVNEQLEKSLYIKGIINRLKNTISFDCPDSELKEIIDNIRVKEILTNVISENPEDCDLVWGIDYHHRWDNWFTNYNVIFPLKTITFEGSEFSCMNNADAFLKRVYGDYMAYPKKIGFGHSMYIELTDEEKFLIEQLKAGLNE